MQQHRERREAARHRRKSRSLLGRTWTNVLNTTASVFVRMGALLDEDHESDEYLQEIRTLEHERAAAIERETELIQELVAYRVMKRTQQAAHAFQEAGARHNDKRVRDQGSVGIGDGEALTC